MNEGLKRFEELVKTDTAFQEKLKVAMESYSGEQTEEAVFETVLVPLAQEYGIAASYEEYLEYMKNISNQDRKLSEDEVSQIAGGTKGFGSNFCYAIGFGGGSAGGSFCLVIGGGKGTGSCYGEGHSLGED